MVESRKKKKTLMELVVGSGMLIVFLPIILLALFGALLGVGLGGFMMLTQGHMEIFWPMLLIYGVLLAIMTFVGVKFSKRLVIVLRRWANIRHERQRVATLSAIRLSDDMFDERLEEDETLDNLTFEERADRHTKSR